ncbi:MAG: hypothetical protein SynsKO_08780 [Synoicihabitans sp.]
MKTPFLLPLSLPRRSLQLAAFVLSWGMLSPLVAQVTITFIDGDDRTTATTTTAPNDPTTLTIASGTATQSGAISGSGAVIKTGTGTLSLTGNNTFSGGTTVSAGTLQGNSDSLSGDITIGNSGTLDFNQNIGQGTFDGAISGNGGLIKSGGNSLILTGDNSGHSGTTLVSDSTLIIGSDNNLGSGQLTLDDGGLNLTANFTLNSSRGITVGDGGATIFVSNGKTGTYGGVIDGTGNLRKGNSGTLVLNGANTYTGATNVYSGTLSIDADARLGTAPGSATADHLRINGGKLRTTADFTINANRGLTVSSRGGSIAPDSGTTLTYNGIIADDTVQGAGPLVMKGEGSLRLGGTNIYTGATQITDGTLIISNDRNLGAVPASTLTDHLTLDNGTLQATSSMTINSKRGINISNTATFAPDSTRTLTYNGVIAGSGQLRKTNWGILKLGGDNTYTGGTELQNGYIDLRSSGALGSSGNITFSGGGLLHSATNTTDYSGRFTTANNQTYKIDTDGQDLTWASDLVSSGGSLRKLGDGILTLSGNNTYTGNTTVWRGWLAITSDDNLGSGALRFEGGGLRVLDTFTLDPNRDLLLIGTGNLFLANNKTLTFAGSLTGNGDLNLSGDGDFKLTTANTYSGTISTPSGSLRLGHELALQDSGVNLSNGELAFDGITAATIGGLEGSQGLVLTNDNSAAVALTIDQDTNKTFSGDITGLGSLTKAGSARLTLSGDNAYAGPTNLNSGILHLGSSGALGSTGLINFNGGILRHSPANTTDYSSRFSSANNQAYSISTYGQDVIWAADLTSNGGSLTKSGSGTLTLSGNNTYTGPTVVDNGTLSINSDNALGAGDLILDGGTLATTNTFALAPSRGQTLGSNGGTISPAASTTLTYDGTVTGSGSLTKSGDGILALGGNSDYTGATIIESGELHISQDSALGASTQIFVNDAVLGATESFTLDANRDISLVSANSTLQVDSGKTLSFDGDINGSGSLHKSGSGTLALSGNATHSGATNVTGGTLSLTDNDILPDASLVTLDAGTTLRLNGNSETIGTITGTGTIALGNPGALTFGVDGSDFSFDGDIAGTNGSITKTGDGMVSLSGESRHTGSTTIEEGILHFTKLKSFYNNTTSRWTADNLTVNSGATALFNVGTHNNGRYDPGDIDIIAGLGSATGGFLSGSTLGLSTSSYGYTYDSDIANPNSGANTLNLAKFSGGKLTLGGNNTYTGTTTIHEGTLELSSSTALGSGALVLNGGSLSVSDGITVSHLANVTGSGGLTKTGNGTLSLSGTGSYSGPTTINDGTLIFANRDALYHDTPADWTAANVIVKSGATLGIGVGSLGPGYFTSSYLNTLLANLDFRSGATLGIDTTNASTSAFTYSSNITDTNSGTRELNLAKLGTGVLTLSGTNTYSGSTHIEQGLLKISSDQNLGAAPGSVKTDHLVIDDAILQATDNLEIHANRGITFAGSTASIWVNNGKSLSYGGVITGPGALNLEGGGLALTGTNTFTGSTTIANGGSLTINDDASLGTAPASPTPGHLTFDNGTLVTTTDVTLDSNRGIAVNFGGAKFETADGTKLTYGGAITGSGPITQQDLGTLKLTGDNSGFDGTINLNSGWVEFSSANSLGTGQINPAGGGLRWSGNSHDVSSRLGSLTGDTTFGTNGRSVTFNTGLSGSGGIIKSGSGRLTLNAANTYTGETRIIGGEVLFKDTLTLYNGDESKWTAANFIVGSGPTAIFRYGTTDDRFSLDQIVDLSNLGTGSGGFLNGSRLGIDTGSDSVELTQVIDDPNGGANSLGLSKYGSGTLELSANNTYSGQTRIEAGTLKIDQNSRLGSGDLIFSGGDLELATSSTNAITTFSAARDIVVNNNATLFANSNIVYDGSLEGGGDLTFSPSNDSYLELGTANSYSGKLTIANGELRLGDNKALQNSTLVAPSPSDLDVGTITHLHLGGLSGSANFPLRNENNATMDLTVGAGGNTSEFSGILSGDGSLTKTGSGVFTLSGNNTFTGKTTINNGRIDITSLAALGQGPSSFTADQITLAGGNLRFANDTTLGSNWGITLGSGGGTLTPAAGTTVNFNGQITGSTTFKKWGGGDLILNSANPNFSGNVQVTGAEPGQLIINHRDALKHNTVTVPTGNRLAFGSPTTYEFGAIQGDGELNMSTSSGSNVQLWVGDNNASTTFSGVLSGNGTLVKEGSGTLTLTGANTFSGNLVNFGGNILLDNPLALQNTHLSSLYNISFGDLSAVSIGRFTNNIDVSLTNADSDPITLSLGTDSVDGTFGGDLSGAGGLTKKGTDELTLTGTNTYTGRTTLDGGILKLGSADAIGDSGEIKFTGGTLKFSDQNSTDYSDRFVSAANQEYKLDTNGETVFLWDPLAGANSTLHKYGEGTLRLMGLNTHSGGTFVHQGTLSIAGTSRLNQPGASVHIGMADGDDATLFLSSGSVANGGTINNRFGYIGHETGSSGTADIRGTWNNSEELRVGHRGDGTLILANNATLTSDSSVIGYAEGATGSASIYGDWTNTNYLNIGRAGTGSLSIRAGGDVSNVNSNLGNQSTGVGTVYLFGDWDIDGLLRVGRVGTGTLNLQGGTLTVADTFTLADEAGSIGTLNWNSPSVLNVAAIHGGAGDATINLNYSSSGVIHLTSNGNGAGTPILLTGSSKINLTAGGTVNLGSDHTYTGKTTVAGTTVVVSSNSSLGSNPDTATPGHLDLTSSTVQADGSVTLLGNRGINLTGANTFNAPDSETFRINGIIAGNGAFKKSGAGELQLTTDNTYGGATTIDRGQLTLMAGSSLSHTSSNLNVGSLANQSDAVLQINSGASADSNNGNIANQSGTTSIANIAGTWTNAQVLNIGKAGDGTLNILSGGRVNANAAELGVNADSSGALNFNTDSVLDISNKLTVGGAGDGIINLNSGGRINANNTVLANDAGSSGTLNSNANSVLNISGQLTVGNVGNGIVNLNTGGTINANTTVLGDGAGSSGTLNLGQGNAPVILNTNSITTGDGTGIIKIDHNLSGSTFQFTTDGTSNGTHIPLAGNTRVRLNGGYTTFIGANTHTGGTAVTDGRLRIGDDSHLGAVPASESSGLNNVTLNGGDLHFYADTTLAANRGIKLDAAAIISVPTGILATIKGQISGAGDLTKIAAGDLKLTDSNWFSGNLSIDKGQLIITKDLALGVTNASATPSRLRLNGGHLVTTNSMVINSNRGIELASNLSEFRPIDSTTLFYGGKIAGTGNLILNGTGTLKLTGTNSYGGDTTISDGTLEIGNGGALPASTAVSVATDAKFKITNESVTVGSITGSGKLVLSSGGTLAAGGNNNTTTFDGIISGNGNLIKNGTGNLTLAGDNTNSGTTTVNGGTLTGNTTSLNSPIVTNAEVVFDQATDGTFTRDISGTGELTKTGAGVLTLTGTNTFSGKLNLNAGTVAVSDSSALGYDDVYVGGLVFDGGTLQVNGDISGPRDVKLNGDGTFEVSSGQNLSLSRIHEDVDFNISGTGKLIKSGLGTVTLNDHNSHSGGTQVDGGTLVLNAARIVGRPHLWALDSDLTVNAGGTVRLDLDDQINPGHMVHLNGGNLILNNTSQVLDSGDLDFTGGQLSATGNGEWTLGRDINSNASDSTATLSAPSILGDTHTIFTTADGAAGNDLHVSGTITGPNTATVIKAGSGTLHLSGDNDFGHFELGAGTVSIGHDNALGTGDVRVFNTGGTLRALGSRTLDNPIAVSSPLTVTGTADLHLNGVLSGSGSITKTNAGVLTLAAANTHHGDINLNGGTVNVAHATALGPFGTLSFGGGILQHSAANAVDYSDRFSTAANQAYQIDTNGQNVVFSTALTPTSGGSLTKHGSGQLTLSGTNTYSGETVVRGGTLTIGTGASVTHAGNDAVIGDRNGDIGTLAIAATGSLTSQDIHIGDLAGATGTANISGILDVSSFLNVGKGGTGTLNIAAGGVVNSKYNQVGASLGSTGTIDVSGTWNANQSGGITNIGNLGNANLTVRTGGIANTTPNTVIGGGADSISTATISGTLNTGTLRVATSGTASLTVAAGGKVDLGVDSMVLAGNIGSSGTLNIGNGGGAGIVDTFRISGGNGDATLNFNHTDSDHYFTTDGTSSGGKIDLTGSLRINHLGTGTTTLTGDNTYSGNTRITAGTLRIGSANAFSPNTHLRIGPNGTFDSNGFVAEFSGLEIAPSGTDTFTSRISGSNGLKMDGTGTLVLDAVNTFTGDTTINSGTVRLGRADALPTGAKMTLASGARFELNGHAAKLGKLVGGGEVVLGNANLDVDQTEDTTFSGNIAGAGGIAKKGSGRLTLSGIHTFTGDTAVTDGELKLNGSAANSRFNVAGGRLSGSGSIGELNVGNGGILAPGNSPGTLNAGNTTWEGAAAFEWEVNDAAGIVSTNWDLLNITGGLSITATEANPFSINLVSLTAGDVAGEVPNFDANSDASWTFVTTSDGITFDGVGSSIGGSFVFNTDNFQNATNGTFGLALLNSGNDLALTYTTSAVPEPSSFAFVLSLLAAGFTVSRRRGARRHVHNSFSGGGSS